MDAFTRRTISAALAAGFLAPGAIAETPRTVVTLLGDSILAGYGLRPEFGPAPALKAELARLGFGNEVRNAGMPGDTSGAAIGRLKQAIRRDTAVCVVEFGGNDRRIYPPWMTRNCLNEIMTRLKAETVSPILLGMKAPATANDADAFNAVFAEVATKNDIPLVADYLAGVTRQADGAHPDAEGARTIAARIAPYVVEALKRRA